MNISKIIAREILDSRGNPTVECDVVLENGIMGRAAVPSGMSTGLHEVHELRDLDAKRYGGKGGLKDVSHINREIQKALIGRDASKQREIDNLLVRLDGTENKDRLGANAILAVSLAVAQASAKAASMPLFQYISKLSSTPREPILPLPWCNILNGGKHAHGSTDIQEFMILPVSAKSFREAVRISAEVFHSLKQVIQRRGYSTNVGDEGGFAPQVRGGNDEAFELISEAVQKAGYKLGSDIVFALDVAASELLDGKYRFSGLDKELSADDMKDWYIALQKKHPIVAIEDGLGEEDWEGWENLTSALGSRTQIVCDDLTVTNIKYLERAIKEKAGNAILIKINQIGTLSETIDAVDMAHKAGWRTIISHRSGETEDTAIAHLAVGLGTGQIKAGSLSRTDRTAKYNELLRIEEILGPGAKFAGNKILL